MDLKYYHINTKFIVLLLTVSLFILIGYLRVHLNHSNLKDGYYKETIDILVHHPKMNIPKKHKKFTDQGYLDCLTHGQWYKSEQRGKYLERMKWIPNKDELTLPSGECGNKETVYQTFTSPTRRALCHPSSDKACCYNNHCITKSVEDCKCQGCLDLRSRLHAEEHIWRPDDTNNCQIREYESEPAVCDMLEQKKVKNLIFVGNSLIRHMWTGLLILLNGNLESGALLKSASSEDKVKCAFHMQFDLKFCRDLLIRDTTICNGKVKMAYQQRDRLSEIRASEKYIKSAKDFLFIFTIGLHDHLNFAQTKETLDQYFAALNFNKDRVIKNGSRIIWMTPHFPGLMLLPKYLDNYQSPADIKKYSENMTDYLSEYKIPVMSTLQMTNHTFSWDGVHFGYGLNSQLAHIFLNYIHRYA
ncbi:unnamed protein product [Owenia fusiformis]|uniref:Uncharacterized protein n=1 Tax=Owenia fusiformis TaxID=6347 RepID=A0A8S4MWZ5_OWEFU|nr:unnamed protein product [Owenia fusiformis]